MANNKDMLARIQQDEYFAAASAMDLWAYGLNHSRLKTVRRIAEKCGALVGVVDGLWTEAWEIAMEATGNDWDVGFVNAGYMAAQLGCEKAGL